MSMKELDQAFELIEKHRDQGHFAGRRPPELIEKAEQVLQIRFPPTYRRFLEEYGAGSIAGAEFYGITRDNFENSSVPNGIWLSLDERRSSGLPMAYILIYSRGDGIYFAIDTSRIDPEGENPVVIWDPFGGSKMSGEVIATDFGAFLLDILRQALA